MERQILKEELSRIWEIMGVNGNKSLIRESVIDDIIELIVKKGSGEVDAAAKLAKIQADYPYLKGLNKTDINKLVKGGADAASVVQKIVGKMSGDQLTSLAGDIYKNSVDIQKLIKDEIDGLTANIKAGKLDVAGAQEYIAKYVNDWIKPVGGSADNLVAKLRTRLMDDLGGQVGEIYKANKASQDLAAEVQDAIDRLMGDVATTSDDVAALAPKIQDEIASGIKSSKKFKEFKIPRNVDPNDLANEIAVKINQRLADKADEVKPLIWDQLSPSAQFKYLDDAVAKLKETNPTFYEKWKTYVTDFFTSSPTKKLKWQKAMNLWLIGMIPVGIAQVVDAGLAMDEVSSAEDVVREWGDAFIKTAIWPAALVSGFQVGADKDYYDSLKSFEEYVIDNQGVAEDTAYEKIEAGDDKYVYYLNKQVGPPGDKKDKWVMFKYNPSLGTFVEKKEEEEKPKVVTPPNPVVVTPPNPLYKNDAAGFTKWVNDKGYSNPSFSGLWYTDNGTDKQATYDVQAGTFK